MKYNPQDVRKGLLSKTPSSYSENVSSQHNFAVGYMSNSLAAIFSASPEDLAEIVAREKKVCGL